MSYVPFLCTVCTALTLAAAAAEDAGPPPGSQRRLTSKCSQEFLLAKLLPRDAWKPFPPASDRGAWEALRAHPLGEARQAHVVAEAERLLGKPWPALPATLYMEFARNGNRSNYQEPYFERRSSLSTLVLAECMEHRGRFLDEIANGIWAICEESSWCLPAHASLPPRALLNRIDEETPDLFACETAMTLALARFLLRPELDGVCPVLCERIAEEVGRRITGGLMARLDAGRAPGWMGGFNNWTPWCASNVLGAAMLLEEDPARLAKLTFHLAEAVDRFIDRYGDDGGCDEGPSYWNEAAGALIVFLELLHSRTGGAVDIFAEAKIAAMGNYIARAHIDGHWFANFSDADARSTPGPGKVYRFGERVRSEALKNLALLSMRGFRVDGPVAPPVRISGVCRPILGPLMEILWIPPGAEPRDLPRELATWLPDIEVLFARESAQAGQGLVLAAKGGHNAESHNHNDTGHFMVFLDGRPGIIDLGRETYTRQTFSARRYELLFTRGLGHNAPVVNGVEQAAGPEYRATGARFRESAGRVELSMRLEKAYPEEAGIVSLERTFELLRGAAASIAVRDAFEMREGPAKMLVPMFAPGRVERTGPRQLAMDCGPRRLILEYEPEAMAVSLETIPMDDPHLRESWGEKVQRIAFSLEAPEAKGGYSFRFRASDR